MGNIFGPSNYDLETHIRRGDIVAVQASLRDGASLSQKNHYGWQALHWASYKGNVELTKLFLDKGADVLALNNDGKQPIEICGYDCRDKNEILKCLAVFKAAIAQREAQSYRQDYR